MRHPTYKNDYPVQVWREERNQEPPSAPFYHGIFDVTIRPLADIMFIPTFTRKADQWPPTLLKDLEDVSSEHEARLLTAALADIVVTPHASLAGQVDFFPMPPLKKKVLKREYAAMFYVTPAQFASFSKELLLIEKQTFWANQYVPLSAVQGFECMKFILTHIVPFQHHHTNNGDQLTASTLPEQNQSILITNGSGTPPQLIGQSDELFAV